MFRTQCRGSVLNLFRSGSGPQDFVLIGIGILYKGRRPQFVSCKKKTHPKNITNCISNVNSETCYLSIQFQYREKEYSPVRYKELQRTKKELFFSAFPFRGVKLPPRHTMNTILQVIVTLGEHICCDSTLTSSCQLQ